MGIYKPDFILLISIKMNQVRKNFTCFRCSCQNFVVVPHYFKGKKCKRCHTFNYFNYIPNYRRRTGNHFNRNNNTIIQLIITIIIGLII